MLPKKYIIESIEKGLGRITLYRPEVHNALHIEMIRELTESIINLDNSALIRTIIIDAKGKNFSAGADLNWMKKGLEQSEEELFRESKELAILFHTIYSSSKVTLVVTKGKVLGGANGIVAAADMSIASPETTFAFTEAKLGLIPATIAPYIARKTGSSIAKEWMLTARNIDAYEAYNRGLVNWLLTEDAIAEKIQEITGLINNNGPLALNGIKELFKKDGLSDDPGLMIDFTSKLIAKFRVSKEGQEGIKAFFEKRKADWQNEDH